MRKIIDTVLIEMADRGDQQKFIAQHFDVSEAAISKRIKRLRRQAAHSAILDKLTAKEQRFVAEIVSGTSQTQSAIKAFDVGSYDSAKAIGNRLMKDGDIQQAIATVMEEEGLSRRYLVRKLKGHVDSVDSNVSLRAVDMGLKLHDAYPANKNLNVNVALHDFMPVDLREFE